MRSPSDQQIETFCRLAVEVGGYASPERALFRCRETFRGIPLAGKSLLEIGAGEGVFSAYAATQGAARVVALEPEAAGSTEGYGARIHRMRDELGAPQFEVRPQTLQDFDGGGGAFDIVLLYNSINHLDEPMCMALAESEPARQVYRGLFAKVAGLMVPGGLLIIADASRHNLFPTLGLRCPLAPTIEWHKHQSPRTWSRVLGLAGFTRPEVSWYRFYPLRHLGPLVANKVAGFFLVSLFRLVLRREGAGAA